MNAPRLSLVAALATNRVIGINNRLPWKLPEDLAHFKSLTLGHPIVMGRKTFESLGRPLPGRRNIVITRNAAYSATGCDVVTSIPSAIELCSAESEIFVIGGAELYKQVLPLVHRLYLTEVQVEAIGDAYFPEFDRSRYKELSRDSRVGEKGDAIPFDFVVYERVTHCETD